jgi:hypothetical protein
MCNKKLDELENLLKKQIKELNKMQQNKKIADNLEKKYNKKFKVPGPIDQYYEIKEIINNDNLDIVAKIILIKSIFGVDQ